jgi:methionyl-tRNA formyltransferase
VRIVFFGSGEFADTMLAALFESGHAPTLVVTRPPRRRRRRGHDEPTPVHRRAEAAGVVVETPAKASAPAFLDRLRAEEPDLFVVAEYGQILSQDLLDIPPHGAINVHGSLLPRHRGASPVVAALLAGDEVTGVSIQRVVRKLDAGPVLASRETEVLEEEDAGALTKRLAGLGAELLVEVVAALAGGNPPAETVQDESKVTICRKLTGEDAVIDWSEPAEAIARRVRAMAPRPGAHSVLQRDPELPVIVRGARAEEGEGEAGEVTAVDKRGFLVGTGLGLLRILELVPAARRPMSAEAFVNGYRLARGERFR